MKPSVNIIEFSDLRVYFSSLMSSAKKHNSRMSQSSFARHIGCSSSNWSNFMSGRRDLSAKIVMDIGKKLNWNQEETSHALSLLAAKRQNITHSFAKNLIDLASTRSKSASRIVKDPTKLDVEMSLASFVLIECIKIPEFRKNPVLIASRLGLSPLILEKTLNQLIENQVICLDSNLNYIKTDKPMIVIANGKNDRVRTFHKQMLNATLERLRSDNTDRRYLGSETFAFNSSMLPEAKKIVDRCLDDLAALAYRCDNPDTIYHAGFQLFEILEKKSG